jgi:glycosyltransferase involved in cell wall biosynthesis
MDDQLVESIAEATDIPLSPFGRLRLKSDNFVHRVRQGLLRRWDRTSAQAREGWLGRVIDATRSCNAIVLSHDPPVLLVAIGGARPLWMVESLSSFLAERRVLFLLLIYWSLENPTTFGFVRRNAERHRERFPKHNIVFLCNSREEERLLDAAGLEAIAANHNQIVSEHIFRPLANLTPSFDAVYNARIARFKRHYLAAAIDRVLHVAYRCPNEMSPMAGRAHVRRILMQSPNHRFANKVVNGLPTRLTPEQVNQAYNQSSVGLCLSPVEGAMYASMEYMLAGLPIVTTPSRGGRDVFFDPDYCLTVDPDPRAVRDAVIALRDKAIPRDIVRQRTLERVEAARRRSLALLDQVLARHGTGLEASAIWPPRGRAHGITYKSARSHIADFRAFKRTMNGVQSNGR